jgi:hypothetical protein
MGEHVVKVSDLAISVVMKLEVLFIVLKIGLTKRDGKGLVGEGRLHLSKS